MSFVEGVVPLQQAYRLSAFNAQQHDIVQNEIQIFLLKGVLKESHSEPGEFVSTIFLRPKSDGFFRMIRNLKQYPKLDVDLFATRLETRFRLLIY